MISRIVRTVTLVADLTPGAFLIAAGVAVTIVGILWR